MAAFFFASPVDIDIRLEGEEARKQVEIKLEKERKESCPVYYDGDSIVGQVSVRCNPLTQGCWTNYLYRRQCGCETGRS